MVATCGVPKEPRRDPRAPARAARRGEDDAGELEAREASCQAPRRQAGRKGPLRRAYAQGHISEEELDAYLAELKNQVDNLRVLVASVEAELSQRREQAEMRRHDEAWLLALGERLAEVEEDTPEGPSRSAISSSGSW